LTVVVHKKLSQNPLFLAEKEDPEWQQKRIEIEKGQREAEENRIKKYKDLR